MCRIFHLLDQESALLKSNHFSHLTDSVNHYETLLLAMIRMMYSTGIRTGDNATLLRNSGNSAIDCDGKFFNLHAEVKILVTGLSESW